ncbi:hypothetical protein GCM10010467_30130 [Actinocorallia glomerata]|uniref:Lipoprotein n=2 Tax=Actinomycetota TaxID=201174 RepID=A0ABP6PXM4_9ACTN
MRRLAGLSWSTIGLFVLSGCSQEAPDHTISSQAEALIAVGENDELSELGIDDAELALTSALDGLESASSLSISAAVKSNELFQLTKLEYDIDTGAFTGRISVLENSEMLEFNIIRTHGLTWVEAPREYWILAGYDADGAADAEGMNVVFEKSSGDSLAQQYDYGALAQSLSLEDFSSEDYEGQYTVSSSTEWFRFSWPLGGEDVFLDVPDSTADTRAVSLVSTAQGAVSVVSIEFSEAPIDVDAPAPETVLDSR